MAQEWGMPSALAYSRSKYSKGFMISDEYIPKVPLPNIPHFELKLSDIPQDCALRTFIITNTERSDEHFIRAYFYDLLEKAYDLSDIKDCEACVDNFLNMVEEHPIYTNTSGFF